MLGVCERYQQHIRRTIGKKATTTRFNTKQLNNSPDHHEWYAPVGACIVDFRHQSQTVVGMTEIPRVGTLTVQIHHTIPLSRTQKLVNTPSFHEPKKTHLFVHPCSSSGRVECVVYDPHRPWSRVSSHPLCHVFASTLMYFEVSRESS